MKTGEVHSPEHLAAFREHKTDLLMYLTATSPAASQFPSFLPPLGFQETGKLEINLQTGNALHYVRCEHLDGEEVIFASDAATLSLDAAGRYEGRVVYRVRELERLRQPRPSAEALRTIHAIKKEWGGECIVATESGAVEQV